MVEAVVEIREAVSKGFTISVEPDFEDSRRRGMDGIDIFGELVVMWLW